MKLSLFVDYIGSWGPYCTIWFLRPNIMWHRYHGFSTCIYSQNVCTRQWLVNNAPHRTNGPANIIAKNNIVVSRDCHINGKRVL